MNGRRVLLLGVVALLLVPGTATGLVRGAPALDVTVADETLVPGTTDELTVTLTNRGDLEVGSATDPARNDRVTTARAVEVTLEEGDAPVQVHTGTNAIGTLPQGKSAQVPFGLTVDENAKPGTYDLEADVEYTHTRQIDEQEGITYVRTRERSFDVTVVVEDRARFEVVDTNTDVRVGSSGTVDVTVRNAGTEPATDAIVTLQSRNGDLAIGSASEGSRFVGDWAPGETRTLEYEVSASPAAERQPYAFRASASFEDAEGRPQTSAPLSLAVTPRSEQRFEVVGTESDVAVGESGTLAVTLRNDGSLPVDDATVTVKSENPGLAFGKSASASRFVGAWTPGAERTVEYEVTATEDAEARSHTLAATVGYEDPEGDPRTSRPLSLGVTPGPETGFALENVTSDLRVGEEGSIRGAVTNERATVARDVVLTLASTNRNVHPIETEHAVGTLPGGGSAEFEFALDVSSAAEAGPRQFTVRPEYRDADGEPHAADEMVTRRHVGPERDAFEVAVEDGTLASGESHDLRVTVTNNADETLTDVSAKLYTDDPISASDDEAYVQRLAPGDSETMTFGVSAGEAIPKAYPVELDVQYDDADGDTKLSRTYTVPVTVEEPAGGGVPPLALLPVGAGAAGVLWWQRDRLRSRLS